MCFGAFLGTGSCFLSLNFSKKSMLPFPDFASLVARIVLEQELNKICVKQFFLRTENLSENIFIRKNTLAYILHLLFSFLPFAFGRQQQTDLVQTVQQLIEASSHSSLLFLPPSVYPPPEFRIYFPYVFADQTVVPEIQNNL